METLIKDNVFRTIVENLTDREFNCFLELSFRKSYPRKTILAEEGRVCKYSYFILKGAACSYYINDSGEKIAIQFALEEYWITDQYSFFSERKGMFTIETLEDCEMLVLSKENLEMLCQRSHKIEHFFRILVQNAFAALQYRLMKTNSEEAESRYLEFAELFPQFLNRIPQYLIASYLGIRPQSLSRIRKNLAAR